MKIRTNLGIPQLPSLEKPITNKEKVTNFTAQLHIQLLILPQKYRIRNK